MKILFVQKALGQEMMGLMYLSRVLKDAGHDCQCLFLPTRGDLLQEVVKYAPDLLCYGTTTGLHRYYTAINRFIRKRYDAVSVFGGIHPTFVPEMLEQEFIDAVCVGEGELALVEFVDRLARGKSVRDVANFHVKEEGRIYANPVRPLVQDLDSLGFPDRELIYANPFYANNKYKVFMTSRGCVSRCDYCFHSGYGKTYKNTGGEYLRRRSVEHVIKEIEQVRSRWPLEFVHFTDDMFNYDKRWQESFLAEYRDRIKLAFSAIFMIDQLTPELLNLYREAGCVNIRIAFETASDDLKKDLHRFKASPTVHQMAAAKMVQDAGIRLTTLNMIGVPGGSLENEINTLKMNLLAAPQQVLVNFIHPYPGTSIDLHGLKRKSYDEYEVSATRSSPINIPEKARVENLHHLFPLVVRFPSLLRALPFLTRPRGWMLKPYLAIFGICMELQYAELLHCTKGSVRWSIAVAFALIGRVAERFRTFAREMIFRRRHPLDT